MRNSFKAPSSRAGKLLALVGGLAAVGVLAFLAVYFLLFPTSSPKPFKLTTTSAASATATSPTAGASTTATSAGSTLAGRWQVASGSLAGYRVREKLAFLPAQSDAVGRTSQITGTASFTDSGHSLTVSAASIRVAVNTLTSDRSMRDEKIHSIGLESDRYPTATFALARPFTVLLSSLSGHVAHVAASGVFVIHGTSRQQTVPLELTLSGSTLQVVGALSFPWSEFNMTAPSVGGFVNVTDKATMEFDLRLQRV